MNLNGVVKSADQNFQYIRAQYFIEKNLALNIFIYLLTCGQCNTILFKLVLTFRKIKPSQAQLLIKGFQNKLITEQTIYNYFEFFR